MVPSMTTRAALVSTALAALLVALSAGAMTAQAATVISTAHYQMQITLTCHNASCNGAFPVVADKRQLNLTRMNCILVGTSESTFSNSAIALLNAGNAVVLYEYLPVGFSSVDGKHTLNQAIDMQVPTQQHIVVGLSLASGTVSSVSPAKCTATGTIDTLK